VNFGVDFMFFFLNVVFTGVLMRYMLSSVGPCVCLSVTS